MRIGVDARCLSVPITGIGQYTLQILLRMSVKENQWFLYSNRQLLSHISFVGDVVVKDCLFSHKGVSTIWSQSVLPYIANRDKLDLFWSPRHHLPLLFNSKTKLAVTIHDLVWSHAPETMRKFSCMLDSYLMPRSINRADGVIAVSKHTQADIFKELPNVNKGKVKVIYEGASLPDPLTIVDLQNIGVYAPFILFVGTLEPRKNLKRLLLAYRNLPDGIIARFKLVIAGGKGWGNEDIYHIIYRLGLGNNVIVLGYVSDQILATLYKYAVLLAMPSLFEGFGLPLVEAMTMRTPVLTSNVSSMSEIVGDAAILVDPTNVNSISIGLEKILSNDKLRRVLTNKGFQRSKEFTWEKAAIETLNFFQEILDEKVL